MRYHIGQPRPVAFARIRINDCTVRFIDGAAGTAKVFDPTAALTASGTNLPLDQGSGNITVMQRFTVAGVSKYFTVTAVHTNDTSGAVNDTPADGDTTLTVDGITGRIPVGCTFTVVGDSLTHTVTDTTETIGNTTSITFTPAIATATGVPLDDAVITFAAKVISVDFTPALVTATVPADNAVITFAGHVLEVKVGDGNVTYTENRNLSYELEKGALDTVREGDDAPMSVTIDMVWEEITAVSGAPPTPMDVLHHAGGAASWISSSSDPCEPFAVDVELEAAKPDCAAMEKQYVVFPDYRWETCDGDVRAATFKATGKCNAKTPITRRQSY